MGTGLSEPQGQPNSSLIGRLQIDQPLLQDNTMARCEIRGQSNISNQHDLIRRPSCTGLFKKASDAKIRISKLIQTWMIIHSNNQPTAQTLLEPHLNVDQGRFN